MHKCAWKLIPPEDFTLGVPAERCGKVAEVRVLRPLRKTDLFLCEGHVNNFIEKWGLRNPIEILHYEVRIL